MDKDTKFLVTISPRTDGVHANAIKHRIMDVLREEQEKGVLTIGEFTVAETNAELLTELVMTELNREPDPPTPSQLAAIREEEDRKREYDALMFHHGHRFIRA